MDELSWPCRTGIAHGRRQIPRWLRRRSARPGVDRLPEPADHDIFLGVAMLPIANVEAASLGIERDAHRSEVRRRILEKLFLRLHVIGRAVAREAHPEDLLFSKIAEEEVAVIVLRQSVF